MIRAAKCKAWLVAHLGHPVTEFVQRKKNAVRERREALANVASLNESELLILYWLLKGNPRQFELHDQAPACALLRKGVLLFVEDLGGSSLCELHPALVSRRHKLLAEIEQRRRDKPPPPEDPTTPPSRPNG
jgi:hypothetical protein